MNWITLEVARYLICAREKSGLSKEAVNSIMDLDIAKIEEGKESIALTKLAEISRLYNSYHDLIKLQTKIALRIIKEKGL